MMLRRLTCLATVVALTATVLSAQTYRITASQSGKTLGAIEFKLLPEVAPKHAAFMVARIAEGFYNGSAFHRVIPNFMIQGGDPNSISGPKSTWGTGGYPDRVPAEFNSRKHVRGIISAARTSDPNSFGGQFFICVANASWLDGQYTIFGEVTSGMNVADQIVSMPRDGNDNPLNKVSMVISPTTSVQETPDSELLQVYPQPAVEDMTVTVAAPGLITLYTTSGTVAATHRVDAGTTTLPISILPCGVYVMQVELSTGTVYRPVIIGTR